MAGKLRNERSADEVERLAMYRPMQDSVPGLDAMYRLLHALIASRDDSAQRVLF